MDLHPLVGRARELAVVVGCLSRLVERKGAVLAVVGEPGIGKSRLLDEVSTMALQRGFGAAWGRASEVGGAPALWPWTEALRSLALQRSEDALRLAAGPGLPLIARLLPELTEAPVTSELESASARFQLFAALTRTFERLAAAAPIALLLDDLHAADETSLLFLDHAAQPLSRAGVLVVLSFRPEDLERRPDAARILWKIARAGLHLPLGRLAGDDAEALLTAILGRAPTPSEADAVLAATEGSPLFLHEYGRLLLTRPPPLAGEPLPPAVRHAIAARLDALPEATLHALARASALGRDLAPDLLAALPMLRALRTSTTSQWSDQFTSITPAALGPAIAAGLLTERSSGQLSFSHVLIREALYARLTPADRSALHLAIADRAQALGRPASEVAHHLLAAVSHLERGAPVPLERLVQATLAASHELMRLLAFDDAARLLERALAYLPVAPAAPASPAALAPARDALARAELLCQLGSAESRAGRLARGKDLCAEAAAIARTHGDATLLSRAALYYGVEFTPGVVDPRLTSLLEEAMALGATADPHLHARVLARLAASRMPSPDPRPPMALAVRAVDLARSLNDRGTLRDVLFAASSALAGFADPALRLALDQELLALVRQAGDRLQVLRVLWRLIYDAFDAGDRPSGETWLAQYEADAADLALPRHLWPARLIRASLAESDGRWADADRLVGEARTLAPAGDPMFDRGELFLAWHRALTCDRRGDLAALEPRLAVLGDAWYAVEYRAVMLAFAAARAHDRELALTLLGRLGEDSWVETREIPTMPWVAEVLLLGDDLPRLARLRDRLLPFADWFVTAGVAAFVLDQPMARSLALLSARLGEDAAALAWFERASAQARAFRAEPILARIQIEHAELLAARGTLARARVLASEAAERAARLAMPILAARGLALAEATSAPPTPIPSTPSAPTPTPLAPTPSGPSSMGPAHVGGPRFTRDGELWVVSDGAASAHFRDSKGLRILAQLVADPHQRFPAVLLDGQGETSESGLDLLDERAIRAYRARAADLRESLEEAQALNDTHRASALRDELERLGEELSRGVGLGGRTRKAASQAERARVNVQRRIKDAVQRIAQALPALGHHLDACVKTGSLCVYEPPPASRTPRPSL